MTRDEIRKIEHMWKIASNNPHHDFNWYDPAVVKFAELFRADSRNATLDEIADKIALMPFGDTAASFAVWIREQKT